MARSHPLGVALCVAALLVTVPPALGATYHVAPGGSDSGSGAAAQPWRTIATANAALRPGDTVLLHAGRYNDQIRPVRSGRSGARITYRAAGDGAVYLDAFPGGGPPAEGAIALGRRHWVTVSGRGPNDGPAVRRIRLQPRGAIVNSFGSVCGGSWNVVENIHMDGLASRGFGFCVNFWDESAETHHNVLRRSFIRGRYANSNDPRSFTEDLVTLTNGAHHNVVEGNDLRDVQHSVVYADGRAHHNVIRDNRISNPAHTALSVWSAGPGNLVEGNLLIGSAGRPGHPVAGPGNALQWGAPESIIRHNLITRGGASDNDNLSVGGLSIATATSFGATYAANDLRVYANTVVDNQGPGIGVFRWQGDASEMDIGRSRFVNNIVYDNDPPIPGQRRIGVNYNQGALTDQPGGIRDIWRGNLIGNPGTALGPIMLAGRRVSVPVAQQPAGLTRPAFIATRSHAPGFVSAATGDYRLRPASPLANRGLHLTTVAATDSGGGTTLRVLDARLFSDGMGAPGVVGDLIAVGAPGNRARVTRVDPIGQTLTLDMTLRRSPGDRVWLAARSTGAVVLHGSAPEVGAYEIGARTAAAPGPLLPGLSPRPQGSRLRCRGRAVTIVGTNGRDVIRGTARADVIMAGRGDDVILARGGNDVVCGGGGRDRIFGGRGHDRLFGGPGNDRIDGQAGNDRIAGGSGRDLLLGRTGNDRMWGQAGNDRLIGHRGRDIGNGGAGRDRCATVRRAISC